MLNGPPQRKEMTSGMHTVCDIYCAVCANGDAIGWKYVKGVIYRSRQTVRAKSLKKVDIFYQKSRR